MNGAKTKTSLSENKGYLVENASRKRMFDENTSVNGHSIVIRAALAFFEWLVPLFLDGDVTSSCWRNWLK